MRLVEWFPQLAKLRACRRQQDRHGDRFAVLSRHEGSAQCDAANVPTRDVEARQQLIVQGVARCLRWQRFLPDSPAFFEVRNWELHHETQAPQECRGERTLRIGCKNRQASEFLHAPQQVVNLDVGVSVVGVFDLAPLSENRVGFVEEQEGAAVLRGVEDPTKVLLRLPDVFAEEGINKLMNSVDSMIVIPNQKLIDIEDDADIEIEEAYRKVDTVLPLCVAVKRSHVYT